MQIPEIIETGLKKVRRNLDIARAVLEGISDDLGLEDISEDSAWVDYHYHDTHAVLKEEIDYEILVELHNIDQSLKNFTGEDT